MNALGSRVALVRPSVTSIVTAFTATLNTEITRIHVCNVGAAARTFNLFHIESGGSFGVANALIYQKTVNQNDFFTLEAECGSSGIMLIPGDSLGVQSSAADDLVYHFYGVTSSVAPNYR